MSTELLAPSSELARQLTGLPNRVVHGGPLSATAPVGRAVPGVPSEIVQTTPPERPAHHPRRPPRRPGTRSRGVKAEIRANLLAALRAGTDPWTGIVGFGSHRAAAARARPDRRARHRPARRTRPGQDPAAAEPDQPARRVDTGDRRLRAGRAPLRADRARVHPPRRRTGRRPAGRLEAPQRAVHREAGHARTPRSPT